jgi:hypothetical protein
VEQFSRNGVNSYLFGGGRIDRKGTIAETDGYGQRFVNRRNTCGARNRYQTGIRYPAIINRRSRNPRRACADGIYQTIIIYRGNRFVVATPYYSRVGSIIRRSGCRQRFAAANEQTNCIFIEGNVFDLYSRPFCIKGCVARERMGIKVPCIGALAFRIPAFETIAFFFRIFRLKDCKIRVGYDMYDGIYGCFSVFIQVE